jgi:hypothetical protein
MAFAGASLLGLFAGTAGAQLNLLTPREAVQVVGMIPEVAEARKLGRCPRFSVDYGDIVDKLGVHVRNGCGQYAGTWINSYEVDLRTGAALGQNKPIKNPEGEALAKILLKEAGSRVLSLNECRCLALEAARSLPGWGGPGRDVTVEQAGAFGSRYRARLLLQDPPMHTERFLSVDRNMAGVHDDETGMDVVSPSLASLASMMLTLHKPTLLTDADALEIARQIFEVKAQASKPCSVFSVGGPLSWEDIFVGVQSHCEGAPGTSSIVVGVNPKTGFVTDPDNQKHFESPAAERVAHERLEELRHEKSSIREKLNAACLPQ